MAKYLARVIKIPLEVHEAIALTEWANLHPVCKHDLIAIPNGGYRNPREAKSLVRQGVKKGVSDYFLSIPRHGGTGYSFSLLCGLWIELKRRDPKVSKLSAEQTAWLVRKRGQGYGAVVAYGAEEAIQYIEQYLDERL